MYFDECICIFLLGEQLKRHSRAIEGHMVHVSAQGQAPKDMALAATPVCTVREHSYS